MSDNIRDPIASPAERVAAEREEIPTGVQFSAKPETELAGISELE